MKRLTSSKEYCPYCNTNLQGKKPLESQNSYGATHFTRKLGMYDLLEDRTVKWKCPDCGGEWDRL